MSFRLKLAVSMTLLVSVIFAAVGTLLLVLTARHNLHTEESRGIESYRSIISVLSCISEADITSNTNDIADILKKFSSESNELTAIRLCSEGEIIYQSGDDFSFSDSLQNECSEKSCAVISIEQDSRFYKQITGRLSIGGNAAYLDIVKDVTAVYEDSHMQLRYYRLLSIGVMLLSAVLSYISAGFLTRPMCSLSEVSEKIAEGDYSLRSDIKSGDETERLAAAFNKMADSLTNKISELEAVNEAQERFVGSFTHEIKTPMTSVIGYADLLRSDEMNKTERIECAEYIFNEARRLENLSNKLMELLVMRNGSITFESADPSVLLDEAAEIMSEKLAQNEITLTTEKKNGICLLEKDLVKSLLINLIDNAVKYSEKGSFVRIVQTMTDDGCRFEITDEGCGIPESEIQRLTEAFYRVDKSRSRKQGGAGLGLALCSEIVKLHNGTIEFISKPGNGTTVIAVLKGGVQ